MILKRKKKKLNCPDHDDHASIYVVITWNVGVIYSSSFKSLCN
jgi:hypothetical protein